MNRAEPSPFWPRSCDNLRYVQNWLLQGLLYFSSLQVWSFPKFPILAIFVNVFFLFQWNILVTFAIFAKFAAFSRFIFSFFMIDYFAEVVFFASFSISVTKFSDKILVTSTNLATACNSCWIFYSCYICYFIYTFPQAVSLHLFLLKLRKRKLLTNCFYRVQSWT